MANLATAMMPMLACLHVLETESIQIGTSEDQLLVGSSMPDKVNGGEETLRIYGIKSHVSIVKFLGNDQGSIRILPMCCIELQLPSSIHVI